MQRLACLEVVLLCRDLVLPQLLLTFEGHAPVRRMTLCGLLFAAQVRDLLAGDYREDLPFLDRLAQVGLDSLNNARNTRNHGDRRRCDLRRSEDFAREAHDGTEVTRRCSFQGSTGLDLMRR